MYLVVRFRKEGKCDFVKDLEGVISHSKESFPELSPLILWQAHRQGKIISISDSQAERTEVELQRAIKLCRAD